jgi:hypothetical protein
MILMVAGVGMFGVLSGLVASVFLGQQDRKPFENRELLAQLELVSAKLHDDLVKHERSHLR